MNTKWLRKSSQVCSMMRITTKHFNVRFGPRYQLRKSHDLWDALQNQAKVLGPSVEGLYTLCFPERHSLPRAVKIQVKGNEHPAVY